MPKYNFSLYMGEEPLEGAYEVFPSIVDISVHATFACNFKSYGAEPSLNYEGEPIEYWQGLKKNNAQLRFKLKLRIELIDIKYSEPLQETFGLAQYLTANYLWLYSPDYPKWPYIDGDRRAWSVVPTGIDTRYENGFIFYDVSFDSAAVNFGADIG